jgi:polyhydroxybutyrate depolymerase
MRIVALGLLISIVAVSIGCSAADASEDDTTGSKRGGRLIEKWGAIRKHAAESGQWSAQGEGGRRTLNWDGLERTYYVHIPPSYDPDEPAPLVLNFHGGGSNAMQQAFVSKMIRKSNEAGFITVHPEATGERALRWNGGPHANREDVDDVGFVGAMLDELEAEFNIDPSRIFATGISSGGFMSYRLACEVPERIAAIAPVAAMLDFSCEPSQPVPLIHFHGTYDRYCPYWGGEGILLNYPFQSVEDTINFWVKNNHCSEEYDILYRNGLVTCYQFPSSVGADVVLCRIETGGHNWPGGRGAGRTTRMFGYCTDDISATDTMWEFFKSVSDSNT